MEIKFKKIVGFLLLMVLLYFLGYLIPITLVLGKMGLSEPDVAEQLNIYSDIMLFGIFLIILYIFNFLWKKNDKYGDNIGVHNKEETMFKNFTYPQITLYSIIVFGGAFILASLTRTLGKGFVGLAYLGQQFSPTDSLVVSTLQIPIAENFMAAFTLGFICLIITFFSVKYALSVENHKILKYLIGVIGLAIFGAIWHNSVYSGSEIALITVAIFWGIGAFISLLTGSFIPFWVMHLLNNFFLDFSRLFSSDMVLYSTISVWFLFLVMALIIYRGRYFGKKRGE